MQLWLWDQAALVARLPDAEHGLVLPDSALSPLGTSADITTDIAIEPNHDHKHNTGQLLDGVYFLQGISGQEQQAWQQGELTDSRWVKNSALEQNRSADGRLIVLDLHRAAPLQATDKRLFGHLALGCVATILLATLLLQAGGVLSLWQQQQGLETSVSQQHEQNQLQQQAMRRALSARERWLSRQALLEQAGQLSYVQALAKVLPAEASFWQRYSYEPGRLQLLLIDSKPDPRDYVRIIGGLPNTRNVQVQLDSANQRVTVQADLTAASPLPASALGEQL